MAWQLGDALRTELQSLLDDPRLLTAFEMRDQIDRASDSVCANIAEGFRRRTHKQFAHFLDIASGSLGEIEDRLIGAVRKHKVEPSRVDAALLLAKRTSVAVARLRGYLMRTPTPPPPTSSPKRRKHA